jgi:molecular chaperone HscC
MIVGIDLGTTHSLVAVWQEGEARLIPNALGQFLTPSVVSISDTDEILIGRAARERLCTQPQRTAATFKRYMGTEHVMQLGKRSFRPEELSSFVLRALKADAEAYLGVEVCEAVVTVPAYFEDFYTLSQPLLARLVAPVERALRDARIRPSALDEVLLVGGATRMPMVRKLVTRLFERFPNVQLPPDEAVALGAAVQAGLKARDKALREVVLTDVCPYSLGVEVSKHLGNRQYREGYFLPILERNVVVPASRVERLVTIVDQQTAITLGIYQGESRLVKDNVFLGSIKVAVPPKAAGEEAVEVRFTYDINGLLEIEATVCSTSHTQRLLIEQSPGVMSPEEIAERLRALATLKIHPRDQAENKATLARAERLYAEHLGNTRSVIGEWLTAFEAVLQQQDKQEINAFRKELMALLDDLDGHAYF